MEKMFAYMALIGLVFMVLTSPIFWAIIVVIVAILFYANSSEKKKQNDKVDSALKEMSIKKSATYKIYKGYMNKRKELFIYKDGSNWLGSELYSLDFDIKWELDKNINEQLSDLEFNDKLTAIENYSIDLELIEKSIQRDEILFDKLLLGLFLSKLTNENIYELQEYTDSISAEDYFEQEKLWERIKDFSYSSVMYILALREFYTFGMVRVFTYDTLSSVYVLDSIIKLPVISPETIYENKFVDTMKKAQSVYSMLEHLKLTKIVDTNDYSYIIPELGDAIKVDKSTELHCILIDSLFKFVIGDSKETPKLLKISEELSNIKDGFEFEHYVASILKKNNYTDIEVTPPTNDYGVDIVAKKDKITYAFQCKFYSSPVGNQAIQEIYSGKNHYHANVGVVVTNNTFTKQAIEQAKSSNVVLWDGEYLTELSGDEATLKENNSGVENDSLKKELYDLEEKYNNQSEKSVIFYPISYLWYEDDNEKTLKIKDGIEDYYVISELESNQIDISVFKRENEDSVVGSDCVLSYCFYIDETVSTSDKEVKITSSIELEDNTIIIKGYIGDKMDALLKIEIVNEDMDKATDFMEKVKSKVKE